MSEAGPWGTESAYTDGRRRPARRDDRLVRGWVLAGLSIGLLALTVIGALANVGSVPVPGSEDLASVARVPVVGLFGNNVLVQPFSVPENVDGLSRIDVALFQGYVLKAPLVFELASGSGEPLRSGAAGCPADSDTCSLLFVPIVPSGGRSFVLQLRAPTAGVDEPAFVTASDDGLVPGGSFSLNGQSLPLDIALRLYYRPQSLSAWWTWIELRWQDFFDRFVNPPPLPHVLYNGGAARIAFGMGCVILLAALSLLVLGGEISIRQFGTRLLVSGVVFLCALAFLVVAIQVFLEIRRVRFDESGSVPVLPSGESASATVAQDFILAYSVGSFQADTPLDRLDARWFTIGNEARPVLFAHSPSVVKFSVEVPENAYLSFGAALSPEVWEAAEADGVEFVVMASVSSQLSQAGGDPGHEEQEQLFWRRVVPNVNPEDRRWFDEKISLDKYAHQRVIFSFGTYPVANNSWDWSGWSWPRLIVEER